LLTKKKEALASTDRKGAKREGVEEYQKKCWLGRGEKGRTIPTSAEEKAHLGQTSNKKKKSVGRRERERIAQQQGRDGHGKIKGVIARMGIWRERKEGGGEAKVPTKKKKKGCRGIKPFKKKKRKGGGRCSLPEGTVDGLPGKEGRRG